MAGLADDADAAYWNAGGLAFQHGLGGCWSGGTWLPGLYPGMSYTYASAGYGSVGILPGGRNLNIGIDYTYFTTGETDIVDEHGNFVGRYSSYRRAVALHAGGQVTPPLGVGMNLKYIRSYLVPDWVWKSMPELGIDAGGSGDDGAVDVGVLYRPRSSLSAGVTLANLGPSIAYTESDVSDPLPLTLRVGAGWTPLSTTLFRIRGLLEADKLLVGAFYDSTRAKPFGQKLQEELKDVWKSAAVEATVLQVFTVRAGYFEDLSGQRGGLVMEKEGQTYHYGLGDVLSRRGLGRLKSVGLCWGLGLGWKDYLHLDVSSDAAVYDFPTENVKLTLVSNDAAGLIAEIGKVLREAVRPSPTPPYEYVPGPREMIYTGSGVLLSNDGLFATCQHVVAGANSIEIYFPRRDTSYPAKVIVEDATNDVAVLRVSGLVIGDSLDVPIALMGPEDTKLGMEAFTIGYPLTGDLGKEPRYSSGSVSALRGIEDDPNRLQIQNPVQPGNSGGPLFSSDGRLMGLVVSRLNALRQLRHTGLLSENVNFAVKVSRLSNLLGEIPGGGKILSRKSNVRAGQPEDVVEQVLPYVGYVLVKSAKPAK
jgi:S1-C subfamily serine protease